MFDARCLNKMDDCSPMEPCDSGNAENSSLTITGTTKKKFMCINLPAIVQNLDKALFSLGGVETIAKTNNDKSKRMELKLRPEDVYSKSVYGDRYPTSNLLMKVKRTKKGDKYEYEVNVLGIIKTEYKYQTMVDYQYLPMTRNTSADSTNEQYTSLTDKLTINELISRDEFLQRDVPLYLPPLQFSRLDLPSDYVSRKEVQHKRVPTPASANKPSDVIGTDRQRRVVYTIFAGYEDETMPTEPIPGAEKILKGRIKHLELIDPVRKLFHERPIWTKTAILARCPHLHKEKLKAILPLISYYFTNGPWSRQWVRYGYDPRTDPGAKLYQLIDFRIRETYGSVKISKKRTIYDFQKSSAINKMSAQAARIQPSKLFGEPMKTPALPSIESSYVFRPDVLPPRVNVFYQLIDILDEEVQALVAETDGKEMECDINNGWCVKDIHDKIRTILNNRVDKLLRKMETWPNIQRLTLKRRRVNLKKIMLPSDSSSEDGETSPAPDDVSDDDHLMMDMDHADDVAPI